MKKLIFFILCFIFGGCEIYTLPSETNLGGGKWVFVDYEIVLISSIQDVKIIKNDTICINSFNNQSLVDDGIRMKQIFQDTELDRRFVVGKTVWEFDSNTRHLYCDFSNFGGDLRPSHEPFWVSFPTNYWETETNRLAVLNQRNGAVTNWTFDLNSFGQGYGSKLKLVSPNIVIDSYGPSGMRDKAVTIKVILTFMR